MAWPVERTLKSGRVVVHIQWRDHEGKIRGRSLGTSDPAVVAMSKRLIEQQHEGDTSKPALTEDAAKALERFVAHVRLTRSEDTADFYEEKLGRVFTAFAATGTPMPRWNRALLEAFIAEQRSPVPPRAPDAPGTGRGRKGQRLKPWGARMVRMHVVACQVFIAWAAESDVACPDFVGRFKCPKVHRKARRNFTKEQRDALLLAARDGDLEVPIALSAFAGMRRRELVLAQAEDIDWDRRLMKVRGTKGHADRQVDMCSQLVEILQRRRVLAGPLMRFDPAKWGAHQRLHEICDKAAAPRYGWHALRHTFGTLLMRGGARLNSVRDLMGHKDISTTSLYVDSSNEDRREDVRRALG